VTAEERSLNEAIGQWLETCERQELNSLAVGRVQEAWNDPDLKLDSAGAQVLMLLIVSLQRASADLPDDTDWADWMLESMRTFKAIAAATRLERERCAKVVEQTEVEGDYHASEDGSVWESDAGLTLAAAARRVRSGEEPK